MNCSNKNIEINYGVRISTPTTISSRCKHVLEFLQIKFSEGTSLLALCNCSYHLSHLAWGRKVTLQKFFTEFPNRLRDDINTRPLYLINEENYSLEDMMDNVYGGFRYPKEARIDTFTYLIQGEFCPSEKEWDVFFTNMKKLIIYRAFLDRERRKTRKFRCYIINTTEDVFRKIMGYRLERIPKRDFYVYRYKPIHRFLLHLSYLHGNRPKPNKQKRKYDNQS